MRFFGPFWSKTPDFLAKIGCQWSYWPDLNRRPADYELYSFRFVDLRDVENLLIFQGILRHAFHILV